MSDLEQLQNGLNHAEALDAEIDAENVPFDSNIAGLALVELPPLRNEIADMLNTLAMAGAFVMPTIPTHYSPENNLKIADAIIKLAERYQWDLRSKLLGENSVILLWVGVAYTVGMPASACYNDYKELKARAREKEVKDAPAPQNYQTDSQPNSVVTGV